MKKRLIVNADDYGRTPGVSRGILQAHREGIVTSTTVMINQPQIEPQLADALSCRDLGVGLHLVFTAWRPVLPPVAIPSLVDRRGYFLDQHTVWARADDLCVQQLREELTAQVERFLALAGRPPDHFDCHHFVHLYPPFFRVYADLAVQFSLPLRVPFPLQADFERALDTLTFLEGFPPDLVRGMIVTNSALLGSRPLAYPDHFHSTFFGEEALSPDYLVNLLHSLPDGTSELMCHPGYVDSTLESSTYRAERERELAILTHPVVRDQVDALGIELITFGSLSQVSPTERPG
jgi:predicted glycoside hydrolase/deacetylase ChbG (UPF0249 family)